MKVFLSWSGNLSHAVASAFRDWLPSVLQFVDPYVSSEDIDKGARWSSDIAQELESSSFGIVILTQENTEAAWIAFEAGALSKALDKSRVSPFLVNLKRSELQGPLVQFQSTVYEQDDVFKLVTSINNSALETEQLEPVRLRRVFDVWWPELEKALDALLAQQSSAQPTKAKKKPGEEGAILEEILELVRSQQRLLADPTELLPPRYLADVLRHEGLRSQRDPRVDDAWEFFDKHFTLLRDEIRTVLSKKRPSLTKDEQERVESEISSLEDVVVFLRRHDRRFSRVSTRQLSLPG
jgi:hypothetical protein